MHYLSLLQSSVLYVSLWVREKGGFYPEQERQFASDSAALVWHQESV